MRSRKTRSGFTLVEVAIAGFLVALLSACVFRGILIVKQTSQATAQRIAAQGICMRRYEEMKAVAFENVEASTFPTDTVLLAALSRNLANGRLMATLSNTITTLAGQPRRKQVDITCTWTFRGRTRSETLHGVIVDGYSTYAESGSLSATIDLTYNYPTYDRPVVFYAKGTDGSVYTQNDLSSMPDSFEATTIVVMPGGGGSQTISIGGKSKAISNEKVVSFIGSGADAPLSVEVRKPGGGRFKIVLSCDDASMSYK